MTTATKRKRKATQEATAPVPDFIFRESGLLYAVACSSLSEEETIARARANAPGTSAGWQMVDADNLPDDAPSNPWPCNDHPTTHKHYLFAC